jgi:hypothetical protein
MARCLPGKHVWVPETRFNGTQVTKCKQCGATKKTK